MKISWRRLLAFANASQSYLARHKEENKLSYAINRVLPRVSRINDRIQEKLADIDITHCVTQKRGDQDVITKDAQGNLEFTREGLLERNRQRVKLLDEEVDFEPYYATAIPRDILANELDAFEGIVISPEVVASIHEERENMVGVNVKEANENLDQPSMLQ